MEHQGKRFRRFFSKKKIFAINNILMKFDIMQYSDSAPTKEYYKKEA